MFFCKDEMKIKIKSKEIFNIIYNILCLRFFIAVLLALILSIVNKVTGAIERIEQMNLIY